MRIKLKNLVSDFEGISQFAEISSKLEKLFLEKVDIDLSQVSWFDANLCAPLGAILYKASFNLNMISFVNINDKVLPILTKNGFLRSYGWPERADTFGTTIAYKRFEPVESKSFAEYIGSHMTGRGIPKMTDLLDKSFKRSILEIFTNSATHSETTLGIFSCGQSFPGQHRLDFSIVDLGIGFRRNIERRRGLIFTSSEAINWAISERNSSKTAETDPIPGGLGLKLLREFISLNGGRLQIISDTGFWEEHKEKQIIRDLLIPFPGTMVNIEINTGDTKVYCLASEKEDSSQS
jgi:hypothetical protein